MKRKTGNFGLSLSLDATNSVTFSRPCVAHVEQISSQRVPFHSPPQGLKYQQSLVYTVNFVWAIHLLRNPIWTSKDPGRCLLQWASDSMENCKLFHFSVSFNARKRYRDLFFSHCCRSHFNEPVWLIGKSFTVFPVGNVAFVLFVFKVFWLLPAGADI